MKQPRALSLVELVAVLAVTSVVLGLAVSMLLSVREADRAISREQDGRREIARLAERLRDDLHAAAKCELDGDRELVLANVGGSDVAYRLAAGGRCERVGGGAVTDAFALPGNGRWTLETLRDGLVRIVWTPSESAATEPFAVVAQVGRLRRLVAP